MTTPIPDPLVPFDESWTTEDSLEDTVTAYANNSDLRGADKGGVEMHRFPDNLSRAMEYIHKMCMVTVRSQEGKEYHRHPTYPEIYFAMFDRGFSYLTSCAEIKHVRARRKSVIINDLPDARSVKVNGWSASGALPFYAVTGRLHTRLLSGQIARLRDLADDLQVPLSTMGVVLFAGGLISATYWFEEGQVTQRYQHNAVECVKQFIHYTTMWTEMLDGKPFGESGNRAKKESGKHETGE